MPPWLFNVYIDAVMKEMKMGMGMRGVKLLEEGKEWRLPGLLYADDLVLYGESEEDLRAMVRRFVEVCKRRGVKVNASKSMVIVLNGEEGLQCEISVDGIRLEHVSEFKYLGCVLDESVTYKAKCHKKVASGRKVGGNIRPLVNVRDLQLQYAKALHETLLVPVLIYGSETML